MSSLLFYLAYKFHHLGLRFRLLFEARNRRASGWKVPGFWSIISRPTDFEVILYVQRFIDSSKKYTLVDVGANSGYWSKRFLAYIPADYIAFEPDPRAFEKLKIRYPHANLNNLCVGAVGGTVQLNLNEDTTYSSKYEYDSRIRGENTVRVVSVAQVALDSVVNDPGLCILKIDVQGGEGEVLDGANNFLDKVVILILEVPLFRQTREGRNSLSDVILKLIQKGFEPCYFCDPGLFLDTNTVPIEHDIIFVNGRMVNSVDKIK